VQHRILGIDPGTRAVGWAVLEAHADATPVRLGSGTMHLGTSKDPIPERLYRLRCGLQELLKIHKPRQLTLEAAFFGKNARSALRIGEARGVVMVTCAEQEMEIVELPPAVIKRRIAGAGAATKEQIARLVALRLGLEDGHAFETFDESDALAVALCGLDMQMRVASVPGMELTASGRSKASARKNTLPPGASLQ
jgi:crossover junction endodeoxyribonuclease RuvC